MPVMGNSIYNVFGILDSSFDLELIGEHLGLVDEQGEQYRKTAEDILETLLEELPAHSRNDRQAWSQFAHGIHDGLVEHHLPRILYNPFLVSMYAVYESAVTRNR